MPRPNIDEIEANMYVEMHCDQDLIDCIRYIRELEGKDIKPARPQELNDINNSIEQLSRLTASQGGRIDQLTNLIKQNHGDVMMAIQQALEKALEKTTVAAELAPQTPGEEK